MCKSCYVASTPTQRDLVDTYFPIHLRSLGFEVIRGIEGPRYTKGVWTCGVCFALVQGYRAHEHFLAVHSDKPYMDIWEYIQEAEELREAAAGEDH